MRKFTLTNSQGETWDLMDRDVSVFHTPAGLGWMDETTYVRAGNNYAPLDTKWSQRAITGFITFTKNAYDNYFAFTRFAAKYPLKLDYTPNNGTTYHVNCRLTTIEKADLSEYKTLECSVTFTALGLFYKTVSVYNAGDSAGGKVYDYTYDYIYADSVAETVSITSDSNEDSPCRIYIYGPCTNPEWRHYVNGSLYASGSMTGTVASGDVLVIDSASVPYAISETDLSGTLIANRYQLCDFGSERFIFLQYGVNMITVSHDSVGTCALKVEAQISYESV